MRVTRSIKFEVRALGEELLGILEDNLLDHLRSILALLHFDRAFGDGEGIGDPPIAGGVHPDVFVAEAFEDVDGPSRGALRFRVKGHPSPIALIKNEGGHMLFNVGFAIFFA